MILKKSKALKKKTYKSCDGESTNRDTIKEKLVHFEPILREIDTEKLRENTIIIKLIMIDRNCLTRISKFHNSALIWHYIREAIILSLSNYFKNMSTLQIWKLPNYNTE